MPFSHTAIFLNHRLQPCCNWSLESQEIPEGWSLKDKNFFHHEYLKNIREKMLKGEKVAGCKRCYDAEDAGVKSMREAFNGKTHIFTEDLYEEPKLTYLDITLSNVCNNKCRMCGSKFSTRWYKDSYKLKNKFYELPEKGITRQDFDSIDVSSLKYLKVLGGEPLMEQDALVTLLRRTNLEDLEVNIITNGTLTPDRELDELLQKCKHVVWSVSIDAYGELNSFLRKDSVWEEVEKNLKWFTERYAVHVHSVISVYNSNKLNELQEYLSNFPVTSNYNIVSGRKWMQPCVLDDDTREWVLSHYNKNSTEYKTLYKYFKENPYEFSDSHSFYKVENEFKKIRDEDWKDVNPELYKVFYNNIGLI